MKKIKLMLIFAIIIATFTSFKLSAEEIISEPCTPDCVTSPWSPVHIIRLHLQRLHFVDVYYVTRKACGWFQDFQILGFSNKRYKCSGNHLQYTQTPEQEMQAVLAAVVKLNPALFDPQIGTVGCSDIWRISNRSCWATFEIVIYNNTGQEVDRYDIKVPCVDSDCCMATVEVCRTADDHITVQRLDPAPVISCEEYAYSTTTGIVPCMANCSWVPSVTTVIDGLSEGYEPLDLGEYNPLLTKPSVKENNSIELGLNTFIDENTIHFQLFSKSIKDINVELYNINGQRLFIGHYNISDGINDLYIENKWGNTDIILFSITSGNNKLSSGKILNK